ncbi:MAG: putative zinc-binding protein [Promethearchaeia archaeon]
MNEHKKSLDNIVLIPCSGSEYNGELARQVAIRLNDEGVISKNSSMLCSTTFLKNILLEKQSLVDITKNNLKSSFLIVIEGCKSSCKSLILKQLGINPDMIFHVDQIVPKERLNLSDLEVFKNRPRLSNIKKDDISKMVDYIIKSLKEKGYNLN